MPLLFSKIMVEIYSKGGYTRPIRMILPIYFQKENLTSYGCFFILWLIFLLTFQETFSYIQTDYNADSAVLQSFFIVF